MIGRRPTDPVTRFWPRVSAGADGCWQWTGHLTQSGYGSIYFNRKATPVHRFAYELLVGKIPDGLVIDHLCRNRGCVNPAHLEPVTERVNILRGVSFSAENAAKTHCAHGHSLADAFIVGGYRECRMCKILYKRRKRSMERALSIMKGEVRS